MPRQSTSYATTERGYRKQILLGLAGVVMVLIIFKLNSNYEPKPNSVVPPSTKVSFDKSAYSLTDPTSIWLIVNKQNPLNPADYVPVLSKPAVALKPGRSSGELQVASVIAIPLERLFSAASNAGNNLRLSSAYRSYQYQVRVYDSIVASAGQASADEQSARPGYSEHQTGLAADVAPLNGRCELQQCFAETSAGQWLAENAYKYGFLIRYPEGKQDVTGYEYEPWHIRYVGTALATEMHDKNTLTMEEFFDVAGGTTYK